MKNLLLIAFSIILHSVTYAQELPADQWTYIEIYSSRERITPPEGPEWLRSFGVNALDINRDGYQDIVCGKYFYLNPGAEMTDTWKRTAFQFAYDGYYFGDLDVVFGGDSQSNQVWWWENPDPWHNPEKGWNRHLTKKFRDE
jgi:hypothetical protein